MSTAAKKLLKKETAAGGPVTRAGAALPTAFVQAAGIAADPTTSTTTFTVAYWFEITDSFTMSEETVIALSHENADEDFVVFGITDADIVPTIIVVIAKESFTAGFYGLIESITLNTNTKYFLMVSVDTTAETQADRVRVWFGVYNGTITDETANVSLVADNMVQNTTFDFSGSNSGSVNITAGSLGVTIGDIYYLDGVALANPGDIVDSYTTNAKPKAYSGSFGAAGVHYTFADSGNLGNDAGPNDTDIGMTGATQVTPWL
jgi:hypothetical protein